MKAKHGTLHPKEVGSEIPLIITNVNTFINKSIKKTKELFENRFLTIKTKTKNLDSDEKTTRSLDTTVRFAESKESYLENNFGTAKLNKSTELEVTFKENNFNKVVQLKPEKIKECKTLKISEGKDSFSESSFDLYIFSLGLFEKINKYREQPSSLQEAIDNYEKSLNRRCKTNTKIDECSFANPIISKNIIFKDDLNDNVINRKNKGKILKKFSKSIENHRNDSIMWNEKIYMLLHNLIKEYNTEEYKNKDQLNFLKDNIPESLIIEYKLSSLSKSYDLIDFAYDNFEMFKKIIIEDYNYGAIYCDTLHIAENPENLFQMILIFTNQI